MEKIINFITFSLFIAALASEPAIAAKKTNPQIAKSRAEAMIRDVAEISGFNEEVKLREMRNVVRTYVDTRQAARSVLGAHFRTLKTDPALPEYFSAFEEYIAQFLSRTLKGNFRSAGFNVARINELGGDNNTVDIHIISQMSGNEGKKVNGVLTLEQSQDGEGYWIVNLSIDQLGLNITSNMRTIFTGFLNRNSGNLSKLIEAMRAGNVQ